MARFCDYCGRKLEDGEICICRKSEEQQTNHTPAYSSEIQESGYMINNTPTSSSMAEKIVFVFKNIGAMVTSPSRTIGKFTSMNDNAYGIIMMGLYVIVMLIGGFVLSSRIDVDEISNMIRVLFVVIGIENSYLFALIAYGITNKMLRQSTTLQGIFSIVGVQSVLSIILTTVVLVMFKLSIMFGILIGAIAAMFTFFIFCINLCEQAIGNLDRKLFAVTITYAIYYIILFTTVYLIVSAYFRSVIGKLTPMDSLEFLHYWGLL